ncbi:hypothetical protein FRB98_006521 [Tulasnella sp. 332]|nr:hypothetical protein FRB98_006521 [Tulasnella sp. 332]
MDLHSVATSGYEPLAILSSDYNTTQHFWYYDFTPEVKRGPLCDPHIFSVGDTFQTSQGAFAWNLDYLTSALSTSGDNPSVKTVNTQGVEYAGTPLLSGTCLVSYLNVVADLASWTVTATARVTCIENSSFPVSASTSFVSSAFIEKASLDANRLLVPIAPNADVEIQNKWAAQVLLFISGLDVLTTLRMNVNPLAASVTSFSAVWQGPSVPVCYTTPFLLRLDTVGFSNMTLTNNTAAYDLFLGLFWNTTSNFVQTMMAAVNLDIGSPCPSYMTEPSMIPQQLYQTPGLLDTTAPEFYTSLATAYHTFWNTLHLGNAYLVQKYGFTFPLYSNDYVYVDASYLCHLNARKSVISLIIATITATYALFMTGWGVVMAGATWFASKPSDSNYCDGHVILEEQLKSLPTSPMGGPLGSPGYFQSMQILPREPNAQTPMPKEEKGLKELKEVKEEKEEINEKSEKSEKAMSQTRFDIPR